MKSTLKESPLNGRTTVSQWDEKFRTQLAECWPEFVNCRKRLEAESSFLLNLVRQRGRSILDAAMGTGCEAVFLAKQGFDVTGNEIDSELARHASELAEQENVTFHRSKCDWRRLAEHFGVAQFDVVLLLGNSLCLLREEDSRVETAENLRAVCKPGGVVVVDERNFDYILHEREEILKGNFRYSGRAMYCGTSIRGRPVVIEDRQVRFAYESTLNGDVLGHLDMHPFQTGELIHLFEVAGFTRFEVFSDFVPGYSDTADFFTYAFRYQ